MTELLAKAVREDAVYLRTDGVWSNLGVPYSPFDDKGSVGMAVDGTVFVTRSDGGASPGGRLYEHPPGGPWSEITGGGGQSIAGGAEFYVVSVDEIWFVGNNIGGIHAVHWIRAGGFTNESFPGYSPGSGNDAGACIVLPNGDVLISIRAQSPTRFHIWRRPAIGPPWVKELDASVGGGSAGEGLFSPDGVDVWSGSDNDDAYRSTDGGLNWSGPFNSGAAGSHNAITGNAANDIYLFIGGKVIRWNGITFEAAISIGSARGAAILGGKPYADDQTQKQRIWFLGGSWQFVDIPGAATGNDLGMFGSSIASVEIDDDVEPVKTTPVSPEQTVGLFVDFDRDLAEDGFGGLKSDQSVVTRAYLRLQTRRGSFWRDPTFGSRLFTIQTLENAGPKVQRFAEEALAPLVEAGEILSVEVGRLAINPTTGGLFAHILIGVPRDRSIEIANLKLGDR